MFHSPRGFNTLWPRQNGRHFADDIFKRIFLNENSRISIKFSLKFVSNGQINNIPALVQIMAWRRSSDKPLSEPMMVSLPTHICVTRPQWFNTSHTDSSVVSCCFYFFYGNMMTSSNGNIFLATGHLCGELTDHRWIPCTKASNAELWCFLWSAPE